MLCGLASVSHAAEIRFDPDRMAVVNGERTFVLGLYETFHDIVDYRTVSDAGFNLVRSPGSLAELDHLALLGLKVWIQTGDSIDLSEDRSNRQAQLRRLVEQFGQHPTLLTWEVPDEALWHAWYAPVQWRMYDEVKQLRALTSGENSKRSSVDMDERLDRLEALYEAGNYSEGEKEADDIWKALGKEQPHPELSISSGAARAEKLQRGLIEGYRFLKTLDAHHPVWVNHAPRNQIASLAAINEGADIVGCDIYPAPSYGHDHSDIADQTLSAVGAYTRRMQFASPEKPVWMVLQAFGWKDLLKEDDGISDVLHRRPTAHELRFMAYDTIVHGARGVLYWGTTHIEKSSQLWNDLLITVRELADLQSVLSAKDAVIQPKVTVGGTWGSVDRTVEVLAKDVDGRITLIIVNEWNERLDYRLSGLESLEGQTVADTSQGVKITVDNGEIASTIPGYGVQVLQPAGTI
jgi:hypothetical protein